MNEDQLTSNPAGQELRSTDRPMYGAAAANVNDTIYIYGGFYGVSPWNMEAMWTLPAYIDPKELTQVKTDAAASPVLIYSQLVYPMGQYLYAFGGHHPTFPKTSNSSSMNATEPLRYYRFDLKYKQWTPLHADQLAPAPLERYWHTATLNADHTSVYVFGGMNMTGATNDFWQYDMQSNAWQSLTLPTIWWKSRCGHTASMLRYYVSYDSGITTKLRRFGA
ncbi:hypothetical protein BC940DRAFT_31645 [Gongronella butleri]|nr:hypothetical protein BC940DRAFT_31645 [Gongronella butleri]